jgi:hypothetical protein
VSTKADGAPGPVLAGVCRVACVVAVLTCGAAAGGAEAVEETEAPGFGLGFHVPGEISGYMAAESRGFLFDDRFPGQDRHPGIASLVLEPEWYYEWNDGDDAILFVPFFRWDNADSERTHFDLRELNYLHVGDEWEVRIGFAKVFWGVTESQHLVDVINQTDGVEDIDEEDKLGQPMMHVSLLRDLGVFEFFVLPGFRKRTSPGRRGRLRPALVVDQDEAEIESSLGEAHTDFAVRWSRTLDDLEIAVSHFYGIGRDPRFRFDPVRFTLVPQYDVINETGLMLQYTGESILWKLEALGRDGQGRYRTPFVAGFEYTFYGVAGSDVDVGVLGEFLYDNGSTNAAPTPFEHDVFAGFRLTPNDVQSTEFLAGAVVDVSDGSQFWNIEGSRRIGDRWRISIDARLFENLPSDSFFFSVAHDDFIQVQVARYF